MISKAAIFIFGFGLVVAGVSLTLKDWLFLVMILRGLLGPVLAVGGLMLLALLRSPD